ncbi:MAG: nucleotide exchange factor GrpE [Rhodospirillaceae bacterium]|nr:nucleotide exchange factor GrpE [Rhodospirillaceae bacterium]
MNNHNEEEIIEPANTENETPSADDADVDGTPDGDGNAEADAEMQAGLDPETAPESDGEEEEADAAADEAQVDPVEALQDQVRDLNDKLLRTLADAENTRRIATREKTDASKYATANFAREMLQVADNLGMAMMTVSEEAREADTNLNNLYVGIDMTMKALLGAFESQGIKRIEAEGKAFDHNFHEAVQQVENPDVATNTVVQVIRQGFTIHDRLLRPAQVLVSTGGPKAEKPAPDSAPGDDESPKAEQNSPYEAGGGQTGGKIDQET